MAENSPQTQVQTQNPQTQIFQILEERFFELRKETGYAFEKLLEYYIRSKEIKEEKFYVVDYETFNMAILLLDNEYRDYIKNWENRDGEIDITLEVEGQTIKITFLERYLTIYLEKR